MEMANKNPLYLSSKPDWIAFCFDLLEWQS